MSSHNNFFEQAKEKALAKEHNAWLAADEHHHGKESAALRTAIFAPRACDAGAIFAKTRLIKLQEMDPLADLGVAQT